MLAFEDFAPGTVKTFGDHLVTREEVISFAAEFDPQPFHLDEAAASRSLLGGLAASGWHMCAIQMRLICDGFLLDSTSMGAPGVEEVRWLRPLRPGTRVGVRANILDARPSKSRPDMGLVSFQFELVTAEGDVVMTQRGAIMFRRRSAQP
jgi:acyl dehydratase